MLMCLWRDRDTIIISWSPFDYYGVPKDFFAWMNYMPHHHLSLLSKDFSLLILTRFSVEREACQNQASARPDALLAALNTTSMDWNIGINAPTLQRLGNPLILSDCIWWKCSIFMKKLDQVITDTWEVYENSKNSYDNGKKGVSKQKWTNGVIRVF